MRTTTALEREVTLADRYVLDEGRVFLSGIQAIVRSLLDQHRVDARNGLRTASLVSGYQGSPLAGLDMEFGRLGPLAAEHDLVLRPALNEELAATAVWGSQLSRTLPGARFDGVVGLWYGKAPGVDRAADAIRHGNFVGTDPRGGVVSVCGDDPACKSSTLPSASEALLAALRVPVLFPGSVQEVIDLGRHAIACSRASGLWVALKIVTKVADANGTADVGLERVLPVVPELEWEGRPYIHQPSGHLLAPPSLEMERTLSGPRLELARMYARVNGLNAVTHDALDARLGLITVGTAHHDVVQALADLGAGDVPLRILQIAMPFPLDEQAVRAFAAGLDEIVVVEEKGPFVERFVKEALYGSAHMPLVLGTHDDRGHELVPASGALGADAAARVVGTRLLARGCELPSVRERLERLDAIASRPVPVIGARRTPFFCSGCPHNTGTAAGDDETIGAGIGCHTLVLINQGGHGQISGITQMGGEGAQWLGMSPFVEPRHFVQNIGDGTFHHSGSLALRAAVAAEADMTYKLLYNDAVAMTGGQRIEGQMAVPELARALEAEGVRRIIITTEDTSRYAGASLPAIAEVRDRSRLLESQRELAALEGVTVLIHDQACAAELRRARKRGRAAEPPQQVLINERVCEGCGDCGEKSKCLSVEPVATEFGRKTRIHQASCNKDFSCLEGDCPSFLEVIPPNGKRERPVARPPQAALPEPRPVVPTDDVRIRMVGIGGTGVVTANQVLGVAAMIDGYNVSGLDQTGLSQKAGPVVSDIRLTAGAADGSVVSPAEGTDVLLAFDLLGTATPVNLAVAKPERTIAVACSSITPTGGMVVDPIAAMPDVAAAAAALDGVTRSADNFYLDARGLSHRLFADHMPANLLVIGAAWQRGAIPISHTAIEHALRLNGGPVDQNLAAFEWGRAAVATPEEAATLMAPSTPAETDIEIDRSFAAEIARRFAAGPEEELRRLLEIRVSDLAGWGGGRVAETYLDEVERVRAAERARLGEGETAVSEAFARGLHKLTAYKDEYEVARLHLEGLRALPRGTKVKILLHPPLLRALGLERKLRLGRWFVPVLRALRAGRRLRGTVLDPFGHTRVRRVERALPGEYTALVDRGLTALGPDTRSVVVEIAELPELVRGYEEIKLAGVARMRTRAEQLVAQL